MASENKNFISRFTRTILSVSTHAAKDVFFSSNANTEVSLGES